MTGYSGAPLAGKLGIAAGSEVLVVDAPAGYRALLEPLPDPVRLVSRLSGATDLVHGFCTRRRDLVGPEARAAHGAALNARGPGWLPMAAARPWHSGCRHPNP